jgi:hypothetical protein
MTAIFMLWLHANVKEEHTASIFRVHFSHEYGGNIFLQNAEMSPGGGNSMFHRNVGVQPKYGTGST